MFVCIKALQDAADQNAPMVKIKPRRECETAPWSNLELEEIKIQKNELVAKNRQHYTSTRKKQIVDLTKKTKSLSLGLKSKYYEELLDKHKEDSRKLWEILKRSHKK